MAETQSPSDVRRTMLERLAVGEDTLLAAVDIGLKRQLGPDTQVDPQSIGITPIDTGVASGTSGVWRLTATTVDGVPTSNVLKGLWNQPGKFSLWDTTNGTPSDPFHWLREAKAYSSRLLENPAFLGIRAPHFRANVVKPESLRQRRAGILIEEVDGVSGTNMNLDQFQVVAQRLGSMQGYFMLTEAAGIAVTHPWLAKGYTREYVRRVDVGMMNDPDNEAAWSSPLLAPFQQKQPGGQSVREATMKLWDDRGTFLDILDALPTQSIAHNDLWYGQLALDPDDVLVMDFAALGHGPVGQDMGKLSVEVNSRDFHTAEEFAAVDAVLMESYLAGMKLQGVDVDSPLVRDLVQLGWSAGVAAGESYRLGADWVPLLADREISQVVKQQWGDKTPEDMFAFYLGRSERVLHHEDVARTLAAELAPVLNGERAVSVADLATPETSARLTQGLATQNLT